MRHCLNVACRWIVISKPLQLKAAIIQIGVKNKEPVPSAASVFYLQIAVSCWLMPASSTILSFTAMMASVNWLGTTERKWCRRAARAVLCTEIWRTEPPSRNSKKPLKNWAKNKWKYCCTRKTVSLLLRWMDTLEVSIASRKHAYIILTPLNPTFIY